jgi:hypothetical protein
MGALNETVAVVLPRDAVTLVGAPGTPCGVTEFEGVEVEESPIAFVALTVNVYAVPLESPVAIVDVAVVVVLKAAGIEIMV